MEKINVKIDLKSHGNWELSLEIGADYEKVKEQIDLFYEKAISVMDKVIEKEVAYHEGVTKHIIK